MNRGSVLLALALLASRAAFAHPPVGIVVDRAGNVFFSDLRQVWRLGADGTRVVAVPGVHTHELSLDGDGTLHGEHLWHEGERLDRWGHYLWRRRPDGRVERDPPREGFLRDSSFVRDAEGAMYWAEGRDGTAARDRTRVVRRAPDGATATLATGFTRIGWMSVRPDSALFAIDDGALKRVDRDGRVTVLARGLDERSPFHLTLSRRHAVAGLAPAADGSVYVANPGRSRIRRVSPDGRVETFATSPYPWSPWGLAISGETLWVLECAGSAVRVRRLPLASRAAR